MEDSNDTTQPINVCLVEPHRIVRAGLRMLVERHPRLRVVREAASYAPLAAADGEGADVLLLSHDFAEVEEAMPSMPSRERPRLLVLTASKDPDTLAQAIRMGAVGVVLKDEPVEVLHKAIEKVHVGEAWFDRASIAAVLSRMARANEPPDPQSDAGRIAALTKRERQVLTLAAEGFKSREIAERLFISEATVRHHLSAIFGKLGVADRLELIIFAYRNALVRTTVTALMISAVT